MTANELREKLQKLEFQKSTYKHLLAGVERQEKCSHLRNQLGLGYRKNYPDDFSFCGLMLPDGELIGICQYCQLKVSSRNPDHAKYFKGDWVNQSANMPMMSTASTTPAVFHTQWPYGGNINDELWRNWYKSTETCTVFTDSLTPSNNPAKNL